MHAYLLGTLVSFGAGYITCHYNLVTKLFEAFNDIPSTTHKVSPYITNEVGNLHYFTIDLFSIIIIITFACSVTFFTYL